MFTAEVKGRTATRFRAYTGAKMTRKPSAQDHYARAQAGKPPYPKGTRIRYGVEEVAFQGGVTLRDVPIVDSSEVQKVFLLGAGDTEVTRVAFYDGDVKAEVCVGSVEVNASGDIEIELTEPEDDGLIIDEE